MDRLVSCIADLELSNETSELDIDPTQAHVHYDGDFETTAGARLFTSRAIIFLGAFAQIVRDLEAGALEYQCDPGRDATN
jgi:hypothetical protein